MSEFGVFLRKSKAAHNLNWDLVFSAAEAEFGKLSVSKDDEKVWNNLSREEYAFVYFQHEASRRTALEAGSMSVNGAELLIEEIKSRRYEESDGDQRIRTKGNRGRNRNPKRQAMIKEDKMRAANTALVWSISDDENEESVASKLEQYTLIRSMSWRAKTEDRSAVAIVEFQDSDQLNIALEKSKEGVFPFQVKERRVFPDNEKAMGERNIVFELPGGDFVVKRRRRPPPLMISVDNLPLDATEDEIRNAFQKFGDIKRASVNVKDEMALVAFEDLSSVEKAIEKCREGVFLENGARLEIRTGKRAGRRIDPDEKSTVIVTCEESELTESNVLSALSQFGEIKSINVQSKRCYASVLYSEPGMVNSALEGGTKSGMRSRDGNDLVIRVPRIPFRRSFGIRAPNSNAAVRNGEE